MPNQVRCNKCDYIGNEDEFPTGRDLFQKPYIASCPKKCGNRQNPGDASMRMFDNERPFSFVRGDEPEITGNKTENALPTVIHRATEAS